MTKVVAVVVVVVVVVDQYIYCFAPVQLLL